MWVMMAPLIMDLIDPHILLTRHTLKKTLFNLHRLFYKTKKRLRYPYFTGFSYTISNLMEKNLRGNLKSITIIIHQFQLRPYHFYWILHVKQKYSFDTQRKKMKLDVEASVNIKGCDKHHIRVTKKGQRRHYPVCIFHNTSVAGVGFCRRFSLHQIVVLPPFLPV